jgi:hypothetical protein
MLGVGRADQQHQHRPAEGSGDPVDPFGGIRRYAAANTVIAAQRGDCPRNGVSGPTRRPVRWRERVADDRDTAGREPADRS